MRLKDFIKNSSIVFVSTIVGGVFSFAFHPAVARFLSVRDFAELQALLSLSVVLGVPTATLSIIIVRYTSKFYAEKNLAQIKYLERYFFRLMGWGGAALFLLFLLASPAIAGYLKIGSVYPVAITGAIMFLSVLGGVFGPILQGMQKFISIGVTGIAGAFLRLFLGTLFSFFFLSVYGALGGIALSSILGIGIVFSVLRRHLKEARVEDAHKAFRVRDYSYYIHIFFIALFLTAFFNMDVLLVKNIFDVETAGLYAAAAVLAKAIVFASGALESVMFPVVVGRYEQQKDYLFFFLRSVAILVAGLLFSVWAFSRFGNYFILLMGSRYAGGAEHLWKIAVFVSLYVMVNYLSKFLLAIKKTSVVYILGVGVVLQIIFGYTFSKNLPNFIKGVSYALLATLLMVVFYLIIKRKTLIPHEEKKI